MKEMIIGITGVNFVFFVVGELSGEKKDISK